MLALVIGRTSVQWHKLHVTAPDLEARVTFYRALLRGGATLAALRTAGERLYRELLEPLRLPASTRGLILLPSGSLFVLPFDALVMPVGEGRAEPRFLAQALSIRTVLSARMATTAPRKVAAPTLLSVGDPPPPTAGPGQLASDVQASLGPLHASAGEARGVAARVAGAHLLVGAEATEARVRRAPLEELDVVHFATHGLADPLLPMRSALVLGGGDGEDGLFTAEEILARRMNASLVVLSGCRTAGGAIVGGEGQHSLARAFLQAGADAVLASQWEVDDEASAAFMRAFYDQLAEGAAAADALTAVKRSWIKRGRSSAVWSAFQLVGGSPKLGIRAGARSASCASALGGSAFVAAGLLVALAACLLAASHRRRNKLRAFSARPR